MKFGFLAFDDFEELDLIGPWEMAGMWREKIRPDLDMFIVSETGKPVTARKGLKIHPDYDFAACPALDLLLVPGGQGRKREVNNPALLDFVKQQAANCRHVLSVCTGAFLLQKAGLLTGLEATTYWSALDELRATGTAVREDRFINNGKIWTAAGVSAGIDMMLALVAEMDGAEAAGLVQLAAEYYPDGKRYGTAHLDPEAPGYLR